MKSIFCVIGVLLSLSILALTSCKSARRNDQHEASGAIRFVDQYFTNICITVEHREIFPGAMLREEGLKLDAIADLASYLEGRPGAPMAEFAYWPMGSAQFPERVRARDYWACVLSYLTGLSLHLYMPDNENERDRKIAEFLIELRLKQQNSGGRRQN
jgi:hypothetical protein